MGLGLHPSTHYRSVGEQKDIPVALFSGTSKLSTPKSVTVSKIIFECGWMDKQVSIRDLKR